MTIKELAIQNIREYNQDNPFNSDKEFSNWHQYNIFYQDELQKFFKKLTQTERNNYYQKVFERESLKKQLTFF